MEINESVIKRFWIKVFVDDSTNNCWEWLASTRNGYGCFKLNGNVIDAHRIGFEIQNGPIVNRLWVLHKCDNRRCVRGSHLFLGTPSDNTQDCVSKRRHNSQRPDYVCHWSKPDPSHGMTARYKRGCRCCLCKAAKAKYLREWKAKRKQIIQR